MSEYPTMQEVEEADRPTLAKWYRNLPHPGASTIEFDNPALSDKLTKEEQAIYDRIVQRFIELGGLGTFPQPPKTGGWIP